MNFLVLFIETNDRAKWVNNENKAKEIARFCTVVKKKGEKRKKTNKWHIYAYFYLCLLFCILFVTLSAAFKVPFVMRLLPIRKQTSPVQQVCKWFIFCKVYGSGQVQAKQIVVAVFSKKFECILWLPCDAIAHIFGAMPLGWLGSLKTIHQKIYRFLSGMTRRFCNNDLIDKTKNKNYLCLLEESFFY